MAFDRRDAQTSLKSAFPPAHGAVPRRPSRTVREAVRRLDEEIDALVVEIHARPFNDTLQELAERLAR